MAALEIVERRSCLVHTATSAVGRTALAPSPASLMALPGWVNQAASEAAPISLVGSSAFHRRSMSISSSGVRS